MKLLQVVHGFPPELDGGTERYVQALSRGLAARGHAVVVLAGTLVARPAVELSETQVDGVRVVRLHRDDLYFEDWDKSYHPGVSRACRDLLAREAPDLVHVHHWIRLTRDLVRQSWLAGLPSVLTLHDFTASCPILFRVLRNRQFCTVPAGPVPCRDCVHTAPWWGANETERGLTLFQRDFANEVHLANRVLALSASHAQMLAQVTDQSPLRFVAQPFRGVNRLRPAPAPPPGPPFQVANWGHQNAHKGQDVLLRALAAMRHRHDVRLHLFGPCDDPWFDQLLGELARDLPVTRHGRFEYAELERTPLHLAVLPSMCHETYGLVLDEARMLGVPAVVTDLGAYHERIGAGGVTFPRDDHRALAQILDALLEDQDRLARMRACVTTPGPFTENVDWLEQLYHEVIAEGPRPVRDGFDAELHLLHEHARYDARERRMGRP